MIPRRAFIKRGGKALQRTRARSLVGSRMVDSKLERQTLEGLLLLERAGHIRNLKTQVTHQLYAAQGNAFCSCQCKGDDWKIGMCGEKRIYAPRLDFQFEERKACGPQDHSRIAGSAKGNCWELIYADAKGWMDRGSAQYVAYKLFAAIHGQEIRLYRGK